MNTYHKLIAFEFYRNATGAIIQNNGRVFAGYDVTQFFANGSFHNFVIPVDDIAEWEWLPKFDLWKDLINKE